MNENNENLKPVAGLQPFRHFCMSIGELPASYLETMTYYEMLVWFTKYLGDTVIPTINNNAECIEELQNKYIEFTDDITTQQENFEESITTQQETFETNITNQQNTYEEHITGLFNELQSFVNNYFDNLDVQEEINNKLDDMVEQGTLQAIISEYLNSIAIFGFDNVSSMSSSTNLINGSYARTMGYYSKNDGGDGLYKIRTKTNDDIVDGGSIIAMSDNTLIAELIYKDYINVKQFGAKGDGETDDTTVFKTVISKYKNIYIPHGQYVITDTLFINSNQKIIGEKNNTFFNGYQYGTTIIFNSIDTTIPCISFLGINNNTELYEKDTYIISGSLLDNETYAQTISSELRNINILSNNNHNVAVVFTGCPNSQLQVSCYGFIFGIITSASWGSIIENSFVLGKFGIMIGNDCNDVKFSHIYCNCNDKNYTVSSDNTLLYSIVAGENVEPHHRNITSGIMCRFVNFSSLEDVICEHFKVGFNFGSNSSLSCFNIYGEDNDKFAVCYSGIINIDGAYMFNENTTDECIAYNLCRLNLSNARSTYPYLIKEYSSPTNRYGNFYLFSNVRDNTDNIDYFNSNNPSILYLDTTALTNGSGLKNNPINSFDSAVKRIGNDGTIYLLSNCILPTTSSYYTIDKKIKITSDSDNKKTIQNTESTSIYPVRYLKDLTLENLIINISTTQQPSDVSLSSLFNPYTSIKKKLELNNCTINTSSYNGLINADYNKNTYTDLILYNCSLTGGCILSTNHYGGSSKKLFIKEYISGITSEVTKVYGSQTDIVESYAD